VGGVATACSSPDLAAFAQPEPSLEEVTCLVMQGCAPRLCRACGAAAKAALKRGAGEGPPPGAAKGGKKHASGGASAKGQKGGKQKGGGGGGAAKARVHLAQPAVRGVTAARAERGTHRHKKLFTSEPGALTVRCHPVTCTLP
jgi:hypothetical protein